MMNLQERVIQLHDIARQIEQEIGKGSLSESVRENADRLHYLIKDFRRTLKSDPQIEFPVIDK